MTTTTASDADAATGDDTTTEPVARPPSNLAGIVCGIVVFAYVVFFAVEVVVAGLDHRLYNRLHEIQGNVVSRVVLSVVVGCALYHGLNGLRLVFADVGPLSRHQDALRSLVAFATFALAVPTAAVILWPSISDVFR
jgi:succinate dehydrogenase/fumarate reductase cytochrome b subunit